MLSIHDRYPEREPVAALSDPAFRLDMCARAWAAGNFTDGVISLERARLVVRRFRMAHVAELLTAGLWRPAKPGYYELVEHMEWNESLEEFRARQRRNKENALKGWETRRAAKSDATGTASRKRESHSNRNVTRIRDP